MTHSRYMIFGDPVTHSRSPLMHNYAFRGLGIDACYGRWKLADGHRLRETFFALGIKGANITVPHKEAAFAACDVLDPFAKKVGAVNTLVEREGKLYGYNTDAPGFLRAIQELKGKKVLFLGAGGTAQSTAVILKEAGYNVTILNRSAGRLEKFRDEGFATATFETFTPEHYDLIVKMTSAGLEDESLPAPQPILEAVIPEARACIDVIYGKETPFLRLARTHAKPTKDGSDMLLYQGIIAFEHFTDHAFSFDEIRPHMQKAFDFN